MVPITAPVRAPRVAPVARPIAVPSTRARPELRSHPKGPKRNPSAPPAMPNATALTRAPPPVARPEATQTPVIALSVTDLEALPSEAASRGHATSEQRDSPK